MSRRPYGLTLIEVSRPAWEAIAASLPEENRPDEPVKGSRGGCGVWLETHLVDQLGALRGPGESYSEPVLRLFGGQLT